MPEVLIDRELQQTSPSIARSFSCSALIGERAYVQVLPIDTDLRLPPIVFGVPGDAAKRRRASSITGSVLTVTALCERPKVRTPIVQSIAITMVALDSIPKGQPKQFTVQGEVASDFVGTGRTHHVAVCAEVPTPLVDPCSIGSINDGVGADRLSITGAQRDQNDILIVHRGDLQESSLPRPGRSSGAGHCCVNYICSHYVGVA